MRLLDTFRKVSFGSAVRLGKWSSLFFRRSS